jgi:hypothetical protein
MCNGLKGVGAAQSEPPRSQLLHLLEQAGVLRWVSARLSNEVDVFARLEFEMLVGTQPKPTKNRYVYLEYKASKRCMRVAPGDLDEVHQLLLILVSLKLRAKNSKRILPAYGHDKLES